MTRKHRVVEARVRGFVAVDASEAERERAAKAIVAIVAGAKQPDADRPEAVTAGAGQSSLAQVTEPISYREVGHLLDTPGGFFDNEIGGRSGGAEAPSRQSP